MAGATKGATKPQQKAKAKGRKIGRHRDRSPSAKAYTAGKRWEVNRKKRAKRHARRMARLEVNKLEWAMSKGKTTLSVCAGRLTELRAVIAQNH